jgi:hypothetical protein
MQLQAQALQYAAPGARITEKRGKIDKKSKSTKEEQFRIQPYAQAG